MKLKNIIIVDIIRILDFITQGTLREAIAASNLFDNEVKREIRSWNTNYKTNCYLKIN